MDDHELARILLAACDQDPATIDPDAISDQLRQALLRLGSETPDNLVAADRIGYGLAEDRPDHRVLGLKVNGSDILLAEIANVIETLQLPRELQEWFPTLTSRDWDAATRMITMLLLALEREADR